MFESVFVGEPAIGVSPPDERSKQCGFARAKRLFPRAGALAGKLVAAAPTIHARGMHQTARLGSFADTAEGTSSAACRWLLASHPRACARLEHSARNPNDFATR